MSKTDDDAKTIYGLTIGYHSAGDDPDGGPIILPFNYRLVPTWDNPRWRPIKRRRGRRLLPGHIMVLIGPGSDSTQVLAALDEIKRSIKKRGVVIGQQDGEWVLLRNGRRLQKP